MIIARTRASVIALSALPVACSSTPLPHDPSAELYAPATPSSAHATQSRSRPSAPALPEAALSAAIAPPSPALESPVAPPPTVAAATPPAHLDATSALSTERSIYFDFDDFTIKPEYAALIVRHGTYLISHPTVVVKIEGHADERGGSEYNLAPAQERRTDLRYAAQ